MDWIKVTIYTSASGIEPLTGVLYQIGVTGLEIEDEDDFYEFLENNHQYWDYVDEELKKAKHKETCINVYVSDNASGHETLLEIKNELKLLKQRDKDDEFGRLEISLDNISEEDWANNWKKYFHPMEVGEKVLIKPEWEELREPSERIVFNVNPGMSFGSGTHHTTQLCIEALEKYVDENTYMLDLGCGSGILSIIGIMLGAKGAAAVDIDPNAVDIAYENAQRNGVDKSKYTVLAGDITSDKNLFSKLSDRKYNVITANIVADVIIAVLPAAAGLIDDNGVFIASGIIEDRIEDVSKALSENGFDIKNIERRADWACIVSVLKK